ncbi:MAG: hypothetical protein AAGE03_18510, partial [Pseudomonadota bacterium]
RGLKGPADTAHPGAMAGAARSGWSVRAGISGEEGHGMGMPRAKLRANWKYGIGAAGPPSDRGFAEP